MTVRSMKRIYAIAFSEKGFALAQKIADTIGAEARRSGYAPDGGGSPMDVHQWTAEHFNEADALIYVGAAGIAVRAIAPYVKDKTTDPAVVVIDEQALHVIPLLSGHLGGANDLARRISRITGSDCVITTATDVNGVFAVDEWAKRQEAQLLEKERIMHVSSAILAGRKVALYSRWPIEGEIPEGIDLIPLGTQPYSYDADQGVGGEEEPEESRRTEYGVDESGMTQWPENISTNDIDVSLDIEVIGRRPLHLVPKVCVLGVGCRRGTSAEAIEDLLFDILEMTCIHPAAICGVATIDLKKDEPGLAEFCEIHGWPLHVYSSEQLRAVEGNFTPSAFVANITGVDNVCERSAVLASGGELLQPKVAVGGVTMAIAMCPYHPDWTWQNE